MDPKFAGKPIPTPYLPGRTDIDHMPDTPSRGAQHRRAHSETFFRFPDLDDILIDDVVMDINPDLPPTPPQLPPAQPKAEATRPPAHLRSLSVDADFFEGLMLDVPPTAAAAEGSGGGVGGGGARPRHRHSYSMDGCSSTTSSCEVDSNVKKAMAADKLKELAMVDPKRAKRILANRQSAARSKERKVRYTSELERKVQTLQTEATALSAQITILQRDTTELTTANKELKLKLQALEQQAHLRDALNDALRSELQRLKIEAGQVPAANGNNRGLPPQSQTFHYFGNHQPQQQRQQQTQQPHNMPQSTSNSSQVSGPSQPGFRHFNQRT